MHSRLRCRSGINIITQLSRFTGVLTSVYQVIFMQRESMNKLRIIWVAVFSLVSQTVLAQDTNELKTAIGVFDTQTGVVIVRGYGLIGTLSVGTDEISVLCKESTDTSSGHKADGLAIKITGNPLPQEKILVDYDEIDSLLNSISYLNKITYNVTPLPSFEAGFSTKAGLRVAADSIRREGGIKTYLEYGEHPKILLSSVQLMQLYTLIEQAKNNLDSIKSPK